MTARSRPRRAESSGHAMPPIGAAGAARGGLTWDAEAEAYHFQADDCAYRVIIGGADERTGLLHVEGRVGEHPWQPLVRDAGMLLREEGGAVLPPAAAHERCELESLRHSARGRILSLRYGERLDGRPLKRSLEIRMAGRALEIRVDAPGGRAGEGYCGFSLGHVGPEDARRVLVPGLPDPLYVLRPDGFLCGYADRFQGRASAYPPGGAFYRPDGEGVALPVSETLYLTLSSEPLDPLPSLPKTPPPFRSEVERRVTLDFYSEQPYADDDRLLRLLPRYGLHDVLLIYRNWQHFGYARRGPLLYPADLERGGNETFRRMLAAAAASGWLVALREEYAALAPDSPYWDEKALARWGDGAPRLSRRRGEFGIAAFRMLEFARLEATKIQRNYPVSAVFVDGHTAWHPEACYRQVDDTAGSPSRGEARVVRQVESLLGFLREVHEGPVIGGAGSGPTRFDTLSAGFAEAVVRGPDGGQAAPLIVDYELREVRPALLGLGAGSYRQFSGHQKEEAVDAGRVDWDAYRATEIALGHAGYVGNYRIKPGPRGIPFPGGGARTAVREYYMVRALQELYLGAAVRSIAYAGEEGMLTLAQALQAGLDLSQARIRVEYGGGLTVWVNRSSRERWRVETEEGAYDLPPSGFAALAPRKLLAYSAEVGGNRADFCRAAAYTFVDARSQHPRRVEGVLTDGAVALLKSATPGRQDLVLVGVRQLTLGEGEEYRLSERADVRLSHVSTRELEVTVMDSESGKPIHVAWPAFTAAWKAEKLRVLELEGRAWVACGAQVQQTRTGPQLSRARPGATYRISAPQN